MYSNYVMQYIRWRQSSVRCEREVIFLEHIAGIFAEILKLSASCCSYNIKLLWHSQNFKTLRTQETKIVEKKFFEYLFFSDFNTGQENDNWTVFKAQ